MQLLQEALTLRSDDRERESLRLPGPASLSRSPSAVADMEPVASNIQVLLQAAEFLERREREAEHGYASLCPHHSPGTVCRRRKAPLQAPGALNSGRHVHNELEKRRRAQLKRCLEQLRQQMPLGVDHTRYTTLSLLRRARMHIQKLEEQEQQAQRLKEKLRSRQQSLQQQLEQLQGLLGVRERDRLRADSLDSSGLSSERFDSDQEDLEVDVESLVFGTETELLQSFSAGQEHSYSHSTGTWL